METGVCMCKEFVLEKLHTNSFVEDSTRIYTLYMCDNILSQSSRNAFKILKKANSLIIHHAKNKINWSVIKHAGFVIKIAQKMII